MYSVTPEVLFRVVLCRTCDSTADFAMSPRAESSMVLLSSPETSALDIYFSLFGIVYSFLLFFFIFSIHVSRPCSLL